MNDIKWDWSLFEAMNFDGPMWLDSAMIAISGIKMWIPLYLLIIYMVWRNYGWRGAVALLVALAVAIGIAPRSSKTGAIEIMIVIKIFPPTEFHTSGYLRLILHSIFDYSKEKDKVKLIFN